MGERGAAAAVGILVLPRIPCCFVFFWKLNYNTEAKENYEK